MDIIIQADCNDCEILTTITKKSKAYWGYDKKDLESWDSELTITKQYIEEKSVYKLVLNNKIAGYYAFICESISCVRLDYFFVSPEFIGRGYGSILLKDFLQKMENYRIKDIILDADPNAQVFYEKFGFKKVSKIPSSIQGRFLPVMHKSL